MDSCAQHAQLITMTPLSAAVLISPPLRAGEKHGLDFEAPIRPARLHGIILWLCDDSISATPGTLTVLFEHAHIFVSSCTRRLSLIHI